MGGQDMNVAAPASRDPAWPEAPAAGMTRAPSAAARLLVSAMLALLLAACGDLERPFSKGNNPALRQGRPPPPPIVLHLSDDVPEHARNALVQALAAAARRRGLTLLTMPSRSPKARQGLRLAGDFETFRDEAGTRRLAYVFRLQDAQGRILREVAGTEPVREGAPDPWAGIADIALPRMSETVAESLSAHFALQGYGTQGAGLPPPPDILVQAGPDAERDIDPDLLAGLPVPIRTTLDTGPDQARKQGTFLSRRRQAMKTPLPANRSGTRSLPQPGKVATAGTARENARTTAGTRSGADDQRTRASEADGREHIRSVAVLGVAGAPGKGNAELARALRQVLRRAGWPVHATKRPDALLVRGRVLLDPPRNGRQRVRVIWTVKTPKGVELGTVKQENTVPAGSLDAGFGKAAPAVAEGAAEGLFRLVARFRQGRQAAMSRP